MLRFADERGLSQVQNFKISGAFLVEAGRQRDRNDQRSGRMSMKAKERELASGSQLNSKFSSRSKLEREHSRAVETEPRGGSGQGRVDVNMKEKS
jgi:hypothetical protein